VAAPLVVNVAELFRAPGTVKDFSASVETRQLEFGDARVDEAGDTVEVRVRLESASEGIVVTGTAGARWRDTCRRCLARVSETTVVELDDVFVHDSADPEAWRIVEAQIDLAPMVREAVLLALPTAPLCRADCPGLCPECGADLAEGRCECLPADSDDRWDALEALRGRLPDDSPG